jgi:DNA-binding FrmR family transcriptional regulator
MKKVRKGKFFEGKFAKWEFLYTLSVILINYSYMKIKDVTHKKRVGDRLRRIEWQIRWVIQMIEDEAEVRDIIQQLSAIRSAMGQAMNEEIICTMERMQEKKGWLSEKELAEIKDLMKIVR